MADKVQLTLESLIPDLDELSKKGIFQRKDIKKILKKRRQHEYSFEKSDVSPSDYFKAIKYEKILNSRMKQIKKKLNLEKKVDYYDFHFIRRIIVLFKKCLIKFGKNENIWMEYFNFLMNNNCINILNKEIGKCLIQNPTNINFWKIAVYNEFENNLNNLRARKLMQGCIRMNNKDLNAYLEYFTFEIKFAEKISERKTIIKGNNNDNNKLKIVNDIIKDDNIENEKLNTIDNIIDKDNENDKFQNENKDEISNLIIPELILNNAFDNIKPNKKEDIINFYLSFLEKLERYAISPYIHPKHLEDKIISEIKKIDNVDIDTLINIIEMKLIKNLYNNNKSQLGKDICIEFLNLLHLKENEKYKNYIIYKLLLFISEKISNDEIILNLVFEKIKNEIDIKSLEENYFEYNNLKLLVLISSNSIYSENLLNNKTILKFSKEILIKIISNYEEQFLKEIFEILNNLKSYEENLLENITNTKIKYKDNPKNNKFIISYIKEIMKLISSEITYYLKPELSIKYFQLIENQILNLNNYPYEIVKELYKNMLSIIIDKCIQIGDSDYDNGEKYYNDIKEYIKKKMEKQLIGFILIKRELINSKHLSEKEQSLLNWIK
jgi:hypothetical protein